MKQKTVQWLYAVPGGKNQLYIVILTVVQSLLGTSGVWYAFLMRELVDSAVGGNTVGFWTNVAWLVGLTLGQLLLRVLLRHFSELGRTTFENAFKKRLFCALLHKEYGAIDAVHSGEWMNRLTNDTVVVSNGYVEIIPGLAGMVVKLISALVMLLVLDLRFGAILLPCGAALALLSYLFRKVLKRMHKGVQEADGRLRIFLQERIGSMVMIRSFAAEGQTEAEAAEYLDAHKAARMRRNGFSNLCHFGFGFVMNAMYLFGVCYCGFGILIGTVTYGTLTAITQLISQIQSPFANLTGYLPRWYTMLASAERLMEAESFADETTEPPLIEPEVRDCYEHRLASVGLEHVSYTYYPSVGSPDTLSKENQPVVLQDVSLAVKKGEIIAFTGHSGCGKSTVLKLLMCLYRPDAGECVLTERDGTRVTLSPAWHRLFAYVPQGNRLMSGTIREIVAFAQPDRQRDDAAIWDALSIACAEEFVRTLDGGLDTMLGERGEGLSEGQMQRISVARAIFSESPILLLDEATSSLDEQTERVLLDNLRRLTDRTVVIVTHRSAALSICDRILHFAEDGVTERPVPEK